MGFSPPAASMKPARILLLPFLSLLSALATPAVHAADPCNDTCQALVREGHALQAQGQFGPAYQKFKSASDASPSASIPASSAAALMLQLSTGAAPERAAKLRASARDMASQAARLAPDDPVAQEVLRELDDGPSAPLHAPSPQAARSREQAEVLFARQRYDEARAKYEEAMRADPAYSTAWVGAGDCYFMQKDLVRAEAMFRRATEIEPLNAQAWRFLSDALLGQGRRAQADAALVAGIGADPSQRPSWSKLAALRAGGARPLMPLGLQRGARVLTGADGKLTVQIDERYSKVMDTPDGALRLTLALQEANLRKAAGDKTAGKPASAYEIELEAWRTALRVVDELQARDSKALTDPALLRMQAMARDGDLEPAILILLFRQAYRPALDAWSAAHPGGVQAFIDRYAVRP
jgi:tetratricopeptide (TPR) repeat protein